MVLYNATTQSSSLEISFEHVAKCVFSASQLLRLTAISIFIDPSALARGDQSSLLTLKMCIRLFFCQAATKSTKNTHSFLQISFIRAAVCCKKAGLIDIFKALT